MKERKDKKCNYGGMGRQKERERERERAIEREIENVREKRDVYTVCMFVFIAIANAIMEFHLRVYARVCCLE